MYSSSPSDCLFSQIKHSTVSMRSSKQIPPTAPPIIADRLESSEPGVVGGQSKCSSCNKPGSIHFQQATYLFYKAIH